MIDALYLYLIFRNYDNTFFVLSEKQLTLLGSAVFGTKNG